MPSALDWYILFIVITFAMLFIAAIYLQSVSNSSVDTTWNTPVSWIYTSVIVGLVIAAVIGVYGSTVPAIGNRESLYHIGPLVVGCTGLAFAAGHGRLALLFRRSDRTQASAVTAAEAGTTVIVTGQVDAETQELSPALSQPAVCWSWEFQLRGTASQKAHPSWRYSEPYDWGTRKFGSGGVPFDLDDGSGPVRVDPDDPHVTLPLTDEQICHPDEPQPGRVGKNLHRSVGGEQFRYREAVVTNDDELTIVGTVTDDGALTARRIYRPARADTARQRYTYSAILLAGGGLVGIAIGIRLTAQYFQTPLPF
jgi:hypothetical protein